MRFYSDFIFPRFYDCLMDQPFWAEYRRKQLASAEGRILEIGIGTGLNLPHYPDHVTRITTVDPNPGMNKKLRRRIKQHGIEVDLRKTSSEELPFNDHEFDTVVSTITLCSIRCVDQAVAEIFRVLRPGGQLLFLEHGISPDAGVVKWQRRLDRLQRIIADGCTLMLDLNQLLATQPFKTVKTDNFYMEQTPRTHGYMYQGVATR